MPTFELNTLRLRIRALLLEDLQLLKTDRRAVENRWNYAVSNIEVPELIREDANRALPIQLHHFSQNPELYPWWTHWDIASLELNQSIGGFAFAGPPEDGRVFISYWIDTHFQGNGYMTEALKALIAWAFTDSRVRIIEASTFPNDQPSQAVLVKTGFTRRGSYKGNDLFVCERSY